VYIKEGVKNDERNEYKMDGKKVNNKNEYETKKKS